MGSTRRITIAPRQPGGEWVELEVDAACPTPAEAHERRRLGQPAPAVLTVERVEAIARGFSMTGWPIRDQFTWCTEAATTLVEHQQPALTDVANSTRSTRKA